MSFKTEPSPSGLGKSMLSAVEAVLSGGNVTNKAAMLGEYRKLLNEPIFTQPEIKHRDKSNREKSVAVLKEMVGYLDKNIYPLTGMKQSGYDVLGRFYTEFVRYSAGEQSQGLVLTPSHVTELFCDLADINQQSIVYDPCCGSGGFLIAAMKRMIGLSGNDTRKANAIRQRQLVGVEIRPSMFTYACSNMMLRGDGRSKLFLGDCFQPEAEVKASKPTVAFLNPPYDVKAAGQMRFVKHALEVVAPQNGTVIAIVQMGCGIKNEKDLIAVKKTLLDRHHLKAVLSMPDDLFYPIGAVTMVMVWEANKPNRGRETWFGYFKDDGFEKRKHRGRIDARGRWVETRDRWLRAYRSLQEEAGLSVKTEVKASDEWCAEEYMETDFSTLCRGDFERKVRAFVANRVLDDAPMPGGVAIGASVRGGTAPALNVGGWQNFRYDQVFTIKKGFYNKKPEPAPSGDIVFIGATDSNNGVTSRHLLDDIELTSKTGDGNNAPLSEKLYDGNCITVSNNGSVGFAFYQPDRFTCSHDVNPLYLKNRALNKYIAMFLCVLIERERYRWAYGRKWRPVRMPRSIIRLPVTADGTPDWSFMEQYIEALPFSANL
jgi:type I restriction-modification system DNA methylase subunit